MSPFEWAQQELRLLESHWISLLSWLSERSGVAADDLVKAWSADDYYKANTRLTADTKKAAGAKWTILDFIDFGSYVHLASSHSVMLGALGVPPKDWVAQLNRQMARDGLVAFRNQVHHGNRFALLPKPDQERGVALLKAQRGLLTKWWPDCPVSLKAPPAESSLRAALRALSDDPNDALPLIEQIGLDPIANAPNLIKSSGVQTPLSKQLAPDLDALYRVGEVDLSGARASIYLACVREWPERSARREPIRRRVVKALREAPAEEQRIIIFVDAAGKSAEAEFVLPRVRAGKGVGTVRAAVSMADPTRHHVQLLESLEVPSVASIPALARKWIEAFSVETVTTRFYTEFRELRDRLIDDLLEHNADNPALQRDRKKDADYDLELHAFGTRQLSRILFLWFLQQKRWLGNSAGGGNLNFLTDLFRDHGGKGDAFFADVLVPIFFDGLGTRAGARRRAIIDRVGPMPYLGGGIFRLGANEFEAQVYALNEEGEPTRRVVLSDDLFDPKKDEADGPAAKGKSRKRTVLGLLRGYRFTTQESTPDDQSIDPDPELLGKVFENLYQADERHATGAYYTPREIVQFMCRRTLDGYLREQTSVTQATLDWLREEAVDWAGSERKLPAGMGDDITVALERVRVLDPAVGSGAFLLTMMREIVTLLRGIGQSEYDEDVAASSERVADWKRRVATSSLYGVDINPMAVEICHLRLWLSIIVDLEVSNFSKIPALPNLDFRIVAGDSLIDRMGEEPFFESLPAPNPDNFDMFLHGKVKALQKELDTLKLKWANEGAAGADQKRLRDLRGRIRTEQVEIANVQIAHALEGARDRLKLMEKPRRGAKPPTKKQLTETTAIVGNLQVLQTGLHADGAYQKPFLWPVNFHDVFETGGFDIVLANPPYVRAENLNAIDQLAYAHAFVGVHTGTADLLVYFYARAVQVLRAGGQLAFITSNRYMRQAYGEGLRKHLPSEIQIEVLLDFGDLPVFEKVAAYPAVVVGSKCSPTDSSAAVLAVDLARPLRCSLIRAKAAVSFANVRLALNDLEALIAENAAAAFTQALLKESGWLIDEPRS